MPSKSSAGASAGSERPSEPGRSGDGLKARIISAIVMAPVVLAAVIVGGWAFNALVVVLALVAAAEWGRLIVPDRTRAVAGILILGVGVALAVDMLAGTGAALMAVGLIALALYPVSVAMGLHHSRYVAFGVPYVAIGGIAVVWLRVEPSGSLTLLLYLFFVIWATDIGAYIAGKTIGGPKLAPRISPKKTWAGLLGAVVSAGCVGWAVALACGAAKPLAALAVGGVLAVIGQGGDLFESWIKRRYNVKDSGHLIPGHGGLLDRIDGLLAAAPALALFHATLGEGLSWW